MDIFEIVSVMGDIIFPATQKQIELYGGPLPSGGLQAKSQMK